MNKAQSVGLIGTGNLTDSPLTRFFWLSERLGPVKSASYRVASRIANMLQAGHPVKDYAEFESCVLILVCVPEETVSQVVSDMLASEISWRGKAVVLCSTWLDSGELRELAARGAAVGSISPIPGFSIPGSNEERYLVEGDPFAIRQAKSLVEYRERRALAIERPLKPFFLAALTCTGTLLFSLLHVASESLRHARIPPALSATLLERQLTRTLRSFLKGGRRAYTTPRELPKQLRALSAANAELAHYLEQSCRLASRVMSRDMASRPMVLSEMEKSRSI
jgi:predicted short-subunit dehydrogenase-like oxidoreductase (DUF2520 family)